MKRWTLSAPEALFLAGSLVAGLGYLVLFSPLTVADEPFHFYRAFAVTSGELFAEHQGAELGARLPVSLARVEAEFGGGSLLQLHPEWRVRPSRILGALRWPLTAEERAFIPFATSALYPAAVHLPQAVGVGAGRLLGLGPVPLVYLGRLTNLLLCSALTWAAIRITPLGRWGFCWLALAPMAVSSRASLLADALTTAAAFLLVAAAARLAWGEHPPSVRDRLLVAVAAVLLCLTKLPYVPLLLTLVVVGRERLQLRPHRRFWWLAAGGVVVALSFSTWVGWAYQADVWGGGPIDRDRQIHAMLATPLRFLGLVIRDYLTNGRWYVAEMVGVWLGWAEVVLPIAL